MYSFFLASEFNNIDPDKIAIVSIGTKSYQSDKISGATGIFQWILRAADLFGPVKKYTQDFMVEHILRRNKRPWHKFELKTQKLWSLSQFFSNKPKTVEDMVLDT